MIQKEMASIVALITARGGSKGVPGKNTALVGGKPLIAWSIEAALNSKYVHRTIVSTDSEEIAIVAKKFGGEVPFMRPPELAQDRSPHIDVVLHALDFMVGEGLNPDYLLLLQPTSPLRTSEDIDGAIELSNRNSPKAVIAVHELHEHPYFCRRLDEGGVIKPFVPMEELDYPRRQDLPKAYYVNGSIYLNRCDSLRNDRTFYPDGALGYVMPAERSWQIDTPMDIAVVDALMKNTPK